MLRLNKIVGTKIQKNGNGSLNIEAGRAKFEWDKFKVKRAVERLYAQNKSIQDWNRRVDKIDWLGWLQNKRKRGRSQIARGWIREKNEIARGEDPIQTQ